MDFEFMEFPIAMVASIGGALLVGVIAYTIFHLIEDIFLPYLQNRAEYKQVMRELKIAEAKRKIKKIKNKY